MDPPVRVGAVEYLNSKPLIYRLGERAAHARLVLDVPSKLADGLEAGRLDVALVPVFECFRHPHYAVVSDACIASEGPVYSVKLFSRCPVEQVRSVSLDEGSRTSVALVKVLLGERHGVTPRWEPLPLDARAEETETDAVLLIGDRAIHPPGGRWAVVWDLGQEWTQWTGLPFVFAVWAARPDADLRGIGTVLQAVRDLGVAHVAEIAEREGPRVGMTPEECRRYLTVNLHYYLGERERQGLELFYNKAQSLGLLPEGGLPSCAPTGEADAVVRAD